MSVGICVGTTESKETLEKLFDSDFTENTEYFRKDTLSLGFKNEAQRVISECTEPDGSYDIDKIIEIAFASSFYESIEVNITTIGEIQVISVAYAC